MHTHIQRTFLWIEDRTGLISAAGQIFGKRIPETSGWIQAFGSVALFLLALQVATGLLLSLNYAGTPGDAYISLAYIIREVPSGRLIHALHHWGASLLLIVVCLHMIQVFLYAAYRRPREVTWIAGVFLFLLMLGFSLTGYLLPWDNRAYWGTVVTTRIMGEAPLVGPYLQNLMGATDSIGVLTFARFYSLHVLILPSITVSLVVLHLALVFRHGVSPNSNTPVTQVPFYPGQVFKDVVACLVAFAMLFASALFLQAPLERLADPTDVSYVPRPEWYFLFLFQLLKYFKGSLEPIASVGLPSLFVLALFAVPFIDRATATRLRERTRAISLVVLAIAAWTALTALAYLATPKPLVSAGLVTADPEVSSLSPEELAGVGYFRSQRCDSCHNLVQGPPKAGPTLVLEHSKRTADWLIRHFKNPSQTIPGSNMPPILLNNMGLDALSAFLLSAKPETVANIDRVPAPLIAGAQVYVQNACISCHKVNDVGGSIGPKLDGVSKRRSETWIASHFANPQRLSPGTMMPPFHFSPRDEKNLIDYLLSLP